MKVMFSVRLKEELYDRLKAIADIEQRSMNNTLEILLAQSIEAYEKKNKKK